MLPVRSAPRYSRLTIQASKADDAANNYAPTLAKAKQEDHLYSETIDRAENTSNTQYIGDPEVLGSLNGLATIFHLIRTCFDGS